mgnify:CR=1 FL=1
MMAAYLGIDVGSIAVGVVMLDDAGAMVKKAYIRHKGEPLAALWLELRGWDTSQVVRVVRTGPGGQDIPLGEKYITAIVSQLEGVKRLVPDVRNIISIGGGSFSLTRLTDDGSYSSCTTNTACASGTGAFLDQQAMRLMTEPTQLALKAEAYDGVVPGVATRCAVFAKSDMIHLQQEGYSTDAIAAGLCTGLGNSTVDGLLGGQALSGKTVCIGGVSRNSVVIKAVREKLGVEVVVPADPELAGAFGAAHYALAHGAEGPRGVDVSQLERANVKQHDKGGFLRPPLELKLSEYPDFATIDYWVDEDRSEIALVKACKGSVPVTFGLDIGSTSTKAALVDLDKNVIAWIYRKTAGDPIGAVQKLFNAVRRLQAKHGIVFDIRAIGTTGSGRKMIQAVIGADLALNEITAHARAAVFLDPKVDTILELGGQDAKFTQLQNGVVYNSVMNYVCAAGTGSFIEEQAQKLGVPIQDYADFAMGHECPKTSDRCTVYMERDLDILLARGWNKKAVAASVLHSVRDNYLNKVVGGLHIGEHVCFQGATARNRALVAAFEVELGVPIRVSPFCHVTGALGMALFCQERFLGKTAFRGLSFADAKVEITYETCELCHNKCTLSMIKTPDTTVAWGLKCGRDYEATKPVVKKAPGFEYLRRRTMAWQKDLNAVKDGPTIGIPRGLGTYGYLPMWRAFFQALGCKVVLSDVSSEKILHLGKEILTAEFCAPVIMFQGHVRNLLEKYKVDHVFLPHMIREKNEHGFTDAHFCAYLQAQPGVVASLRGLSLEGKRLSPIIQFCNGDGHIIDELDGTVGAALKKTRADISAAWKAGVDAQNEFAAECRKIGEEALGNLKSNELAIVIVGRPYNAMDPGMTLDLARKMAEMGYSVLSMDMLPLSYDAVKRDHPNMFWNYGQRILAAGEYIAAKDNLFGVYFTNFSCGPDSYILTYFKEIMAQKGKPYLMLQMDGHGADAGYLTRIEAALESFHAWKNIPRPAEKAVASAVHEAAPA